LSDRDGEEEKGLLVMKGVKDCERKEKERISRVKEDIKKAGKCNWRGNRF
jgi:hypothetical protein